MSFFSSAASEGDDFNFVIILQEKKYWKVFLIRVFISSKNHTVKMK